MGSNVSSAAVSNIPLRPSSRLSRINLQAEEKVLALLRAGHKDQAVELLMATYGESILAFIARTLRNREAAEDVRQQVFLQAFQGIEKFESRSSLWTWLCSIASRQALDELKRNKRAEVHSFEAWDALAVQPDPSMDKALVIKRRALEQCLGKLSGSSRMQVLMRMYLELSYAEIGEVFEEAHSAVQVRISRILPELQQCLRKKGFAR